jgi:hypothetical protein
VSVEGYIAGAYNTMKLVSSPQGVAELIIFMQKPLDRLTGFNVLGNGIMQKMGYNG